MSIDFVVCVKSLVILLREPMGSETLKVSLTKSFLTSAGTGTMAPEALVELEAVELPIKLIPLKASDQTVLSTTIPLLPAPVAS